MTQTSEVGGYPHQDAPPNDALRFLEALYGSSPPGRILICDSEWKAYACASPLAAVDLVLGAVDSYHRIGLVERKPSKGRGKASDTIALPGVWMDVDVNGSPDGKGGTIFGAAPSKDAAIELLRSVLKPTLLVCSGYGVHAYWLFKQIWRLPSDQEREKAERLVRGWHARLKQEATKRGWKLDSVFDLARVLRPVGSANGKGDVPVPVEFLDAEGPRYTPREIWDECVPPEDSQLQVVAAAPTSGNDKVDVDELLENAKLRRIVARDCRPPGDGSGHAWDWYLACEAVRNDLGDGQIAALIRHSRLVHGDPKDKAGRNGYVDGTIAKARATVLRETKADEPDGKPQTAQARITRRWNLQDDPIVRGQTLGDVATGEAIVYLWCESGKRLRFECLRDLFEPAKHTALASTVTRRKIAPLTKADAVDITQRIIELCGGEDLDPCDEVEEAIGEYVFSATVTVKVAPTTWDAITQADGELERARQERHIQNPTVVFRDGDDVWLPAGALKASSGLRCTPRRFENLMREAGWPKREVFVREPGTRQERADGTKNRAINRKYFVGRDAVE